METTYNKDIAHCSGYCCLLSDQCRRYHLFRAWERRKLPPAPVSYGMLRYGYRNMPRISSIWNKRHHEKWKKKKIVSHLVAGVPDDAQAGKRCSRLASSEKKFRIRPSRMPPCIRIVLTNGTPSRRRCNGAIAPIRHAHKTAEEIAHSTSLSSAPADKFKKYL